MGGINVSKITGILKKYRYSILVLLIGLAFMLIPTNTGSKGKTQPDEIYEKNETDMETRLSNALSQMKGAGKVEVVLTKAAGEEVIYQTNQDTGSTDSSNQVKSNTVTITDAERNQSGLIRQINPERYLGAIVLCQGAKDPAICLAIVDAVSKATGLGANEISVLELN